MQHPKLKFLYIPVNTVYFLYGTPLADNSGEVFEREIMKHFISSIRG